MIRTKYNNKAKILLSESIFANQAEWMYYWSKQNLNGSFMPPLLVKTSATK